MPSIFEEVKARVSMQQAVDFVGLKLTKIEHGKDGEQHRYPCPKCESDDKRALSVNFDKGKFKCFSCDGGGQDLISLVAFALKIRNGEAAQRLKDHFLSAARASGSTKPRERSPVRDGKGRSDASEDVVRPLEILGISDELADRLNVQEEDGRILFEQRDERGIKLGTIAIATRADLPLVEWLPEAEQPQQEQKAGNLKDLWRVVKGAA